MVQALAAPGLVVPPLVLPLGLVQVPDSDPAVAAASDPAAGQASDPVPAQGMALAAAPDLALAAAPGMALAAAPDLALAAAPDLAPALVRASGLAQAQDLAPAVRDLAPVPAQTILLPLRATHLNRPSKIETATLIRPIASCAARLVVELVFG
jgi:hypothetical protein